MASDINVQSVQTSICAVSVKAKDFMTTTPSSRSRCLKASRFTNLSEQKEAASKRETRRMNKKDSNLLSMQLLNSHKYLKNSLNLALILKLLNKLLSNTLVTSTSPVLKPLKKWHIKTTILKKKKRKSLIILIGKDTVEEVVSDEEEEVVEEVEILSDKCSSNSSTELWKTKEHHLIQTLLKTASKRRRRRELKIDSRDQASLLKT